MAPTPSSEESPASASGLGQRHDDKIRRNVACVSCRNSKVRCRPNSATGQPCQRCVKLQLSCVYDKSHKRVTKRSKLELIEQELKTIKEAVNPRNSGETPWSPPKSMANNTLFSEQPTPNGTSLPPAIPSSINLPEPPKPPAPLPKFEKLGPTKPRLLGDRLISGEDIDWYFTKYLQCFHPYVPVLRKTDPDECFQANPTLFWTVVYVASRRYPRDEYTFNALVEQLNRDVWTLLATPNLDLEAIHALMIICAWPFPTIRFVTDPSVTLINVALSACMLLGLHDGLGSHSKFLVGGRINFHSTDLEASTTWISCCILAQRIATYSGVPPPFLQHNDTRCKRAVEDSLSSELMTLYELQRFSNKLHTAMAGHIAAHDGVFESVVRSWEDEFEVRKPFITRVDTDCSRFFILTARLEVQSYYFVTTPSSPPPTPLTILRTYTTAHSIITAALALETTSKLLTHAPNWAYRAIVDAACILVSTLHSDAAPAAVTPDDANAILQQTRAAVQYCSVNSADLPYRGAVIVDTFWSVRHLLPRFDAARRAWPQRVGAAVTFWCMHTFKDALQEAKKSTEGANRGLEAFQGPSTRSNTVPDQPLMGFQDPFPDVDWGSFLDDFGWAGDATVFLGPPQC